MQLTVRAWSHEPGWLALPTHVTSVYSNLWGQKEGFTQEKSPIPTELVWNTNLAALTSCENDLLHD